MGPVCAGQAGALLLGSSGAVQLDRLTRGLFLLDTGVEIGSSTSIHERPQHPCRTREVLVSHLASYNMWALQGAWCFLWAMEGGHDGHGVQSPGLPEHWVGGGRAVTWFMDWQAHLPGGRGCLLFRSLHSSPPVPAIVTGVEAPSQRAEPGLVQPSQAGAEEGLLRRAEAPENVEGLAPHLAAPCTHRPGANWLCPRED